MELNNLRDYNFKISYGPSDDRLHDFYIPALSRSVRYERSAGFFTSTALAVAAAGVARLIKNGGTMRLLVGAQLAEEDVEAIRTGHELKDRLSARLVEAISEPEDTLLRRRLEVIAWMVAEGTLKIKVVLPKGKDGVPLPASVASEYYHPKEGVFTDANGNQIAFSGSVNESASGWIHNYEQFAVYRSWDASHPYLEEIVQRFERLWRDEEPSWIALQIPEAVEGKLLSFRPQQPPEIDPLERTDDDVLQRERILFQFIRDAPFLPNANRLGMATSTVTPLPHQERVADTIVERFPERFLLCDEVGLGKTIEAGIIIRQLTISGQVNRCLILTPKSILKQWQEELYEKFVLNIPRYDGGRFIDVFDREFEQSDENPWNSYPFILASSQLVKRKERHEELLEAEPWDLVVVDEAHHARRKDFLDDRYRPNRLMELLTKLRNRTRGMLLLTATPMQINPVEVWDLLKILGLGGRWGALQDNFLNFFTELRQSFDEVDWEFVLNMVRDFLSTGGAFDDVFCEHAEKQLGLVEWQQLRELPNSNKRYAVLKSLSKTGRVYAMEFSKRHTPLRGYLFRHTRTLLREYAKRGIFDARVPKRIPELVWIPMRSDEEELYNRIEEYISEFYEKYESERKGLGFIMTVYRRRLTSSFYAMKRSLERRLAFLRGDEAENVVGLTDDDIEREDLEQDVSEALENVPRTLFRGEIEYIEDFLAELGKLASDSKLEKLLDDLTEIFKRRETVLVFTQYTDTMDYLREQLRLIYGSQVACYSGRGGEYWNGTSWARTTKEKMKNAFLEGEEIKILLCTEAASEGLNLQTCGVLINYDMPWNPMRVEQRIGRIDRIGQQHKVVWIHNYFYEDTVEATIYQRLSDRIGWFESVVGELQPILAQVARTIRSVAMLRKEKRGRRLEEEIALLRKELDARQIELLKLDEYLDSEIEQTETLPPITLQELEKFIVGSQTLGHYFKPHPEIVGAHRLSLDGKDYAVTFQKELFDKHPNTLRLLSFGEELLSELLRQIEPQSQDAKKLGIIRCSTDAPVPRRSYYILSDQGPQRIENFSSLKVALQSSSTEKVREGFKPAPTTANANFASEDFKSIVEEAQTQLKRVLALQGQSERLAKEEKGRQLLLRAALIEIILSQRGAMRPQSGRTPSALQSDLFAEGVSLGFNEEAIKALRRHKYPFAGMLKLVDTNGLRPSPTDPFYLKIQNAPKESLRRRFNDIRQQVAELLNELAQQYSLAGEYHQKPIITVEYF